MVNSTTAKWDIYFSHVKDYLDKGTLEKDEINYKHEIGGKLADARQAVLDGTDDWADLAREGISGNIIHYIGQSRFRNWIDETPDDAQQALQVLWARDNSSIEDRIVSFCKVLPASVVRGRGVRMRLISQLLMGLDVERYPPFSIRKFENAYDRTGFKKRDKDADEARLYTHALRFLDQLISEAKSRGVPISNRLEAQSVLWQISGIQDDDDEESETDDPIQPEPPELDLQALAEKLYLTSDPDFLEKINALLDDKKQVIFQGPPGTGKTYVARELAYHLAGSQDRVTFVQFHPSYDYEDFVQGYRPMMSNGQPGFKLTDGPLLEAAKRAREDEARNVKHFLVIDEINRGNLAKVFGELYFLLEYRDQAINLQYQQVGAGTFSLPSNLYIIGTMNTADRSIALVDLALRRRFYFVEFHPDDEPIKDVLRLWLEAKAQPDRPDMKYVADCVDKANELLKDNRHAAIGPSYFMKDNLDEEAVKRIWEHSVLPYIEELLFGEGDRLDDFKLDKLCDKPRGANGTAAE